MSSAPLTAIHQRQSDVRNKLEVAVVSLEAITATRLDNGNNDIHTPDEGTLEKNDIIKYLVFSIELALLFFFFRGDVG